MVGILLKSLVGLTLGMMVAEPASAEGEFLSLMPDYLPHFAGLGMGYIPDYMGSDDMVFGVAPVIYLNWGERYVNLQANYLSINLLDDPNWRMGPAGLLRFGRDDVEDPVIRQLPRIHDTLELGAFVTYRFNPSNDVRDIWAVSAQVLHDTLGTHGGYSLSAGVQRWLPVWRVSAVGFSLAATHGSSDYLGTYFSVSPAASRASGLPEYRLGEGMRDIRTSAVFIQPLSPSLFLGIGVLYSRLLGDVAKSPIVSDRGSRDQLIYGMGLAVTF